MPLTLAEIGVENIIKRVGGTPEVKKFGKPRICCRRIGHGHNGNGGKHHSKRQRSKDRDQQGNGAEDHHLIFIYDN